MWKHLTLTLAFTAVLTLTIGNAKKSSHEPGYQVAQNTGAKQCPKGKNWNTHAMACV
jgi:hypothetical protein